MFETFNNMKIKLKITLGFTLVLVILAVVSIVAYINFAKVGHEIEAYAEIVESASSAAEIEARFLVMVRHAREYANSGKEKDAKIVHDIAADLKKKITVLAEHQKDPNQKARFEEMANEVGQYAVKFGEAEKLSHEFRALITERMGPEGVKMTEDLDKMLKNAVAAGNTDASVYIASAREHVLLARLYASILIGRKDESVADKAKREFSELHAVLKSLAKSLRSEQEKKVMAEVEELAVDYEKTVDVIHQDEIKIRNLIDGEMADDAGRLIESANLMLENATINEKRIEEETLATVFSSEILIIIVSMVGFLAGVACAWTIGNGISGPITRITGAMRGLAGGDLDSEIQAQDRGDEIGEMAQAVQVFKDNAIRVKEMEAEQAAQEKRAMEEKKQLMNDMADDFQARVGGVVDTVSAAATELQSSAQSMTATSEETSTQAMAVAAASEEASTNVQTVAAAAEELASSISEISRQVQQSSKIAGDAVIESDRANEMIQGLANSAEKIGEVVSLITDIADQTNLLALNATIEAARAGEAGKGFAVVASEVKNLATQTAKATEEIGGQVSGIQGATEDSAKAIQGISKIINEINEIAATISAAVEEQGAATQEIARNVEQAAIGTSEVSSNISGVTQAAGEAGESASQVLSAANELSEQSEVLKTEVDTFMAQVRQTG